MNHPTNDLTHDPAGDLTGHPASRHLLETDPLDRLRLRRSAKWQTHGPHVLPLFVAEMDFSLAEPVRDALREAVERSDTGYAMPMPALGAAVAHFAGLRWDWPVDPRSVLATADVSVGIVELLRLLTSPGDAVVINPPVYPPFYDDIREAGAVPLEVPLAHDPGDGWHLDLPAIERAFATRPAAYILCSPHNPVGRVHRPDELQQIVDLAAKYEVPVISDEIHAPLILPGATFTPLLALPGAAEVAFSLHSASKAWNLAGLKCATIITAAARTREIAERLPADGIWRVGHFGVLASIAAYTEGVVWLDRLVDTLDHRRALLGRLLSERLPEISWTPPAATYLAWLDCSAIGAGNQPRDLFFERGQVALEPGLRFGGPGDGHVRLNFATSAEILDQATANMAAALT